MKAKHQQLGPLIFQLVFSDVHLPSTGEHFPEEFQSLKTIIVSPSVQDSLVGHRRIGQRSNFGSCGTLASLHSSFVPRSLNGLNHLESAIKSFGFY